MNCEVPIGSVTKHINQSAGGETNVMNHYCTTNGSTFGAGWEHFVPRGGCHGGAGYVPNERPYIAYRIHLDEIDNPPMGQMIKSNYKSSTHKHYTRYGLPHGGESLPESAIFSPTGFVREQGTHIPTQMQLQGQYINGILNKSPANLKPKKNPILHKTYPKDPVNEENFGYGPKYMSTEYKTKYQGDQFPENSPGTVGNREESGFTENRKTEEPLEGRPDSCACAHSFLTPPHPNQRPTGVTIYHTDYWPLQVPNGREPLPHIDGRAAVDTGFSTGNKALPDFVDIHAQKAPSDTATEYKTEYKGVIFPDHGAGKVGGREETGFTDNHRVGVPTSRHPRFPGPTIYSTDHGAMSLPDGRTMAPVLPLREDGFSRDLKVHQIEPQADALHNLSRFSGYQSRSVVARESVTIAPTKLLA